MADWSRNGMTVFYRRISCIVDADTLWENTELNAGFSNPILVAIARAPYLLHSTCSVNIKAQGKLDRIQESRSKTNQPTKP